MRGMKIMDKISLNCLIHTTPKKVKKVKPHYDKNLGKAIMKRLRLKNKANRSIDPFDIANYKKQRNLVVSLNSQANLKISVKI